jgi:hypothetical protein
MPLTPRRSARPAFCLPGALALALSTAGCVSGGRNVSAFAPATPAAHLGAARDFDAGVAAYERGELARALEYFQRAQQAEPNPVVLFNIARVHDALEHPTLAGCYYVACLREGGPGTRAQQAMVAAALERLYGRVGWIVVRSPGDVVLDGAPVLPALHGAPIAVWPGVHVIRVGNLAPIAVRAHPGETLALEYIEPGTTPLVSTEVGLAVSPSPLVSAE